MKLWLNMYTKKKSCRGCRVYTSFSFTEGVLPSKCELGYSICFIGTEPTANRMVAVPLGCCPKPTTNKDYLEAIKHYRKEH